MGLSCDRQFRNTTTPPEVPGHGHELGGSDLTGNETEKVCRVNILPRAAVTHMISHNAV